MARPRVWEWTDAAAEFAWCKLIGASGAAYADWHALAAWLTTYAIFTALFTLGAYFQRVDVKRFVLGFTVIFVITWVCWIVGNEMHLTQVDAAVDGRNRYQEAGLSWGLQLGEGAPYLLALIAGLAIGNFAKGLAARLKEAAKPEWFIKTAIVFLGVNLGAHDDPGDGFCVRADPRGCGGDVRRLPVLLADRVHARAPLVQIAARRLRRARVGNLGLRRLGRDRDGRRDPREAGDTGDGVDARRDLRDVRADRAARRSTRPCSPTNRSSTALRWA